VSDVTDELAVDLSDGPDHSQIADLEVEVDGDLDDEMEMEVPGIRHTAMVIWSSDSD
jgi:hypothetical protein